ncbi:MAG: hypothetical protein WDO73_02040 [Ignavibacteriota bacterium]
MRHPNQATLALHAGGDLGPVRRWLTARHVSHCVECREEIAGYTEMRELLPELAALPEISWNRMAAEIKANVRLGLEAGECVRSTDLPSRRASMTGWRTVVAFASVLVLVGGCLVLEHPAPQAVRAPAETAVASGEDGVQLQGRRRSHARLDEWRRAEGGVPLQRAGIHRGSLHRPGNGDDDDQYGFICSVR